jgi:methionyl-tRNA synthetase
MYFHHFSPLSGFAPLAGLFFPLVIVALVWTIVLKGFALWYAARGGQKWWFIALLIINTLGILEIIYLIWFRPDSSESYSDHSHASHHAHTPAHSSSAQA